MVRKTLQNAPHSPRLDGAVPTEASAGGATRRSQAVEFIVIRTRIRQSKAYTLTASGSLWQEPAARLSSGKAIRTRIAGLADLPPILADLNESDLIVAGRIVKPGVGEEAWIRTKAAMADIADRIEKAAVPPTKFVTRTKADMAYVAGAPALVGGDHDAGYLDDAYRARLDAAGGVIAAATAVWPALRSVEMLGVPSSSCGILNADTKELLRDSRSLHVWMICNDSGVGNVGTLKFFLRLHQHLVLAGWGWLFVSEAGRAEVRSLFDLAASGRGERLWYSGPAALGAGLEQREGARDPVLVHRGQGRLDLETMMPPALTKAEEARFNEIEREFREMHAHKIRQLKDAHREPHRQRLLARGATPAEAERRLVNWERQELDGEALIWLDHGNAMRVADVLADLDEFFRKHGDGWRVTMLDPIEPDYRGAAANVAVMDGGNGRCPSIFSHAHGGQRFELGWSAEDVRRRAEDAVELLAATRGAELTRFEIVDAVGCATGPMFCRLLPSATPAAVDEALSGSGVTRRDIFGWEVGQHVVENLLGLTRTLKDRAPHNGLGTSGDRVDLNAIMTLIEAEDAVLSGLERDGLVVGLVDALAAFWAAAGPDAERLRSVLAVERNRSEEARRGIMGEHPVCPPSACEAEPAPIGAAAEAWDSHDPEPDDLPLVNWLATGPRQRRSNQHNAVNALVNGLRLGPGKGGPRLIRDIRTGDILLSGIRPGSEAWQALRLEKLKPNFIEPLTRLPVWVWSDDITNSAVGWAQRHEVMVSQEVMLEAVRWIANGTIIDPVALYLHRLEKRKVWDGVPRLNGWLIRHGGAEDGPVGEKALSMTMIGAVARALVPVESSAMEAARLDTVMVLAGPQGGRKSAAIRILARSPRWHTESVTGNLSDKDNILNMHQAWITDISEGASLKRSDVTAIKQFITTPHDRIRVPYARLPGLMARRGILVCTVNDDGGGFLADTTGSRRFIVVGVDRIDTDVLAQEVDQLWAEAVARYRTGEQYWVEQYAEDDSCAAELRDALSASAEARRVKSGLEEAVRRWVSEVPTVSSAGRITSWRPRTMALSVLPCSKVLDMVMELGLDPMRDHFSLANAKRALVALGWDIARLKFRGGGALGFAFDERVWLSQAGLQVRKQAALAEEKLGVKKGGRFRRWLMEQRDCGAIYGSPANVGTKDEVETSL